MRDSHSLQRTALPLVTALLLPAGAVSAAEPQQTSASLPAASASADRSLQPPAPPADAESQEWPSLHIFSATLRPFGSTGPGGIGPFGGLFMSLGYEYAGPVNLGIEISPIALGASEISSFAVRGKLAYGSKYFALGATLGSGYPYYFPTAGVALRVGRLNGAYGSLRIAWVIGPLIKMPADAALEVRIPLVRKWSLRLDAAGGYPGTYSHLIYASIGATYLLRGKGLSDTTILSFGAGPVAFGGFGGAALVGIEHRL
jgi:hypothetical protein